MFQWGEYLSYVDHVWECFIYSLFIQTNCIWNTIFKSAVMKRFDGVNIWFLYDWQIDHNLPTLTNNKFCSTETDPNTGNNIL